MTLTSTIVTSAPEGHATPLLAVIVPQGSFPESLKALDRQTGGAIHRLFTARDFKGKREETAVLYPDGPATRVVLVGVGESGKIDQLALRRAASVAGRTARRVGAATVSLWVAPEATTIPAGELAQAMVEGAAAGAWRFLAMQKPPEDPQPELERVELLISSDGNAAEAGRLTGEAVAAGHILARGLQVLPGNVCTPEHLATTARDLGARHGFTVTVLEEEQLRAEGMGGILAVGQGSAQPPRFIVMEYQAKGAKGAPVVLIGKGVTFDTGGISIKPAERMEDMKFDMSGAAAVFGTFEMLGRLKPRLHVIGLVPTAENMPSGTAYRPGDVVKAMNGKTIEIINTDAEGRLLLADALAWAARYQPAAVLDAATLTGAVVMGLGHTAAAVIGNQADLIAEVIAAGQRAGERAWELPCWDEYREHIKSDIADIKNSGGRPAGTITAAWFLREFVDGYHWAHLDIAGTAYAAQDSPAMAKGPTGMGVRLFCEFLLARV